MGLELEGICMYVLIFIIPPISSPQFTVNLFSLVLTVGIVPRCRRYTLRMM